jgi:hypothetical protein
MSKTAVIIFGSGGRKLRVQKAFATSRSGDKNAISPACDEFPLPTTFPWSFPPPVIASATHFPASPNRPMPRAALARSRQAR